MKKRIAKKKAVPADKSIFRIAGEAIGTIGHEIAEGTDKLAEVSQAAVEKISSIKTSITKKVIGKTLKKPAKKKKATVKKTAKKIVKKAAKKIAKKATRKKGAGKKVPAKKIGHKK